VVFNLLREADDLLVELRRDGNRAEALERIDQRMGEAAQAVSVLDDTFTLDVVENFPDLLGLEFVMVQECNEACDRALKVDVVFPERVVGIDEKSLRQKLLAPGFSLNPMAGV
jgi:hypothetical protein